MGYLTTISIKNDALHCFRENPKEFAEAVFDGIHKANSENRETTLGFKGYANYVDVYPSRHADETTLYLNYGNCLTEINPFSKEFEEFCQRNPKAAEDFVECAAMLVREAKKVLKKQNSAE